MMGAAGGKSAPVYVEDIFSPYTFEGNTASHGNGTTQTLTTGLDMAGEGGLVIFKDRTNSSSWKWVDSVRGGNKEIASNGTWVEDTANNAITSWLSNGVITGDNVNYNSQGSDMGTWHFRQAKHFFKIVTYTGDGSANRAIDHGLGSTPGFIAIKNLSSAVNWECWHKEGGGADYGAALNQNTGFQSMGTGYFGGSSGTSPTATSFYVGNNAIVNGNGSNYVAYVWGTDEEKFGEDQDASVIKCGTWTGTGSSANIDVGFEPQCLIVMEPSGGWHIYDNVRGVNGLNSDDADIGKDVRLEMNDNGGEYIGFNFLDFLANGFNTGGSGGGFSTNGTKFCYIAIRRPDAKVGKSVEELGGASKVFDIRVAAQNATPQYDTGFKVDFAFQRQYNATSDWYWSARLFSRAAWNSNNADVADDHQYWNGYKTGYDLNTGLNSGTTWNNTTIAWSFKRAKAFTDVVYYWGTGGNLTLNHNLGVAPDMIIVKNLSSSNTDGRVYHSGMNGGVDPEDYQMKINNTAANGDDPLWQDFAPTATQFKVGDYSDVNKNNHQHVAYLFASLDSVQKLGFYNGTGSTVTVTCGFQPRFIMIKCSSHSGDWMVWDTVRGISAGNDPYILLNTSTGETGGGDDWVDLESDGFSTSMNHPAVNSSGYKYIYWAIA